VLCRTHYSFWVTAALFAAEHGPYWDVGLLAGILYNWWMVRTGRLADCIVAHAVTNGLLAARVLRSALAVLALNHSARDSGHPFIRDGPASPQAF